MICLKQVQILSKLFIIIICLNTAIVGAIHWAEIEDVVKNQIVKTSIEQHQCEKKDIHITFLKPLSKTILDQATSFKVLFKPNVNYLGRTVINVELVQNQAEPETKSILVEVDVYKHFLRTNRALRKNEKVSKKDIKISYESSLKKPRNSLTDIRQIRNQEARTKMKMGQLILNRNIQEIPDVRVGDEIVILLIEKKLELKVKGIALEKGFKGDQVRVKTILKNKKNLKGEIVGKNRVQIILHN